MQSESKEKQEDFVDHTTDPYVDGGNLCIACGAHKLQAFDNIWSESCKQTLTPEQRQDLIAETHRETEKNASFLRDQLQKDQKKSTRSETIKNLGWGSAPSQFCGPQRTIISPARRFLEKQDKKR